MSQERYDVVLKALSGPLASMGEQKFQGPLVRIGTNPGPGGMVLNGYRGVDARQAVITAYSEGEATIGPVGTNPVRLAPHPHVDWREIDPLSGPEYLTPGCAVHLGPVNRGCTIQFVKVERLGVWTAGRVGSAADSVQAVEVSKTVGAARKATPQRTVARIAAATLPIWFLGCFGLTVVTGGSLALLAVYLRPATIEKLGPMVAGEEYYDFVDPTKSKMSEKMLEGLQEPFRRFATRPSAERAQAAGTVSVSHISDPTQWDEKFFEYTMASVEQHVKSRNFFKRLDVVRKPYAEVLRALREAGLPEAIAAMPYTESRYRPDLQSYLCAKGYWQFMPETAYRMEGFNGLDFKVRDCRLRRADGSTYLWSPNTYAPPSPILKHAPYIDQTLEGTVPERCSIPVQGGCRIDDRTDMAKSTRAAIVALKEAWDDPEIGRSGAAVALTIVSHNAGYDDARFGIRKPFNVLPALKTWREGKSESEWHRMYGDNIRCPDKHSPNSCGSRFVPESQHYGYTILAQHILAVCYYGKNYRDQFDEFRGWDSLLTGYCDTFSIPTAKQVSSY